MVKFIVKPVMTTKESMESVDSRKRIIQSVVSGVIVGFICGFIGAGGGMMMLLLLTGILGYELKTAVGTSIFIMTFTALTGSVSHFMIGDMPDLWCLIFCVASTLLWARIAAKFANRASAITLNRAAGVVLVMFTVAFLKVKFLYFNNIMMIPFVIFLKLHNFRCNRISKSSVMLHKNHCGRKLLDQLFDLHTGIDINKVQWFIPDI